MDILIGGALLIGGIVCANLFYYLGLKFFFITFLGICAVWYGLAKLAGLKGREIFWYLDYLSKTITGIFWLIVVTPLCAGFLSNFVKTTEIVRTGLLKGSNTPTWTIIILTILMSFSIALIMGFLGKNHKPQQMIDNELEEQLSDLSTEELKEIRDSLEKENKEKKEAIKAKKAELEKLVDDFVEKQKDETISEIEKLKAENEALKKQLQDKEQKD